MTTLDDIKSGSFREQVDAGSLKVTPAHLRVYAGWVADRLMDGSLVADSDIYTDKMTWIAKWSRELGL